MFLFTLFFPLGQNTAYTKTVPNKQLCFTLFQGTWCCVCVCFQALEKVKSHSGAALASLKIMWYDSLFHE